MSKANQNVADYCAAVEIVRAQGNAINAENVMTVLNTYLGRKIKAVTSVGSQASTLRKTIEDDLYVAGSKELNADGVATLALVNGFFDDDGEKLTKLEIPQLGTKGRSTESDDAHMAKVREKLKAFKRGKVVASGSIGFEKSI